MTESPTIYSEFLAALSPVLMFLAPYWEAIKDFANSSFTTSLAGALGGAWAAQRIAERSKLRETLVNEVRATNAAITLAFNTTNGALALKRQHIKSLKTTYDDVCKDHKAYLAASGKVKAPLRPTVDLRSLPELSLPIAPLQDLVFGRLTIAGRPASLAATVAQCVMSLNTAIEKRNALINTFREEKFPEGMTLEHMYFGTPNAQGSINQEYPDTIEAITACTDDIIFLGDLLCADLRSHGLLVVERNKKLLKGYAPRVGNVIFDEAKQDGWFPDEKNYESMTSAFPPQEQVATLRWWQWFKKTERYIEQLRKK